MKIDIIIDLLKSNPDADWDYNDIIRFISPIEIVRLLNELPDVNWDWDKIVDSMVEYLNYNQSNIAISNFISNNIDKIPKKYFYGLTRLVEPYVIINNPDKNWHWKDFVHSRYIMDYIPFETILKFLGEEKPLNMVLISTHEKFTWDLIEKFPNVSWFWAELTRKASMQFILDHPNRDIWKWNLYTIARNKIPPMDFIRDNITEFRNKHEFSYFAFSRNSRISKEFIEEFIDEKWDWDYMFEIRTIDFDFIIKHKSIIPNFKEILMNNADPQRLYEYFGEDGIDWKNLTQNAKLTCKFINKHINKLNLNRIIHCRFDREIHLRKRIKKIKKNMFVLDQMERLTKDIAVYIVKDFI